MVKSLAQQRGQLTCFRTYEREAYGLETKSSHSCLAFIIRLRVPLDYLFGCSPPPPLRPPGQATALNSFSQCLSLYLHTLIFFSIQAFCTYWHRIAALTSSLPLSFRFVVKSLSVAA